MCTRQIEEVAELINKSPKALPDITQVEIALLQRRSWIPINHRVNLRPESVVVSLHCY
jgi:hypothetical protein